VHSRGWMRVKAHMLGILIRALYDLVLTCVTLCPRVKAFSFS
jgi:hypothetical protein